MGQVNLSSQPAEYLASVDAQAWPGIASVPRPTGGALRARVAEAQFASAAAKAGLALEGAKTDLAVNRAETFVRIAAGGWIGLAEAYLAGEWQTASSADLVRVLRGLISVKYRPKTLHLPPSGAPLRADQPPALVTHYSGDGLSPFQGHFATGVPTTQRSVVKSWVRGAGRGGEPARHFVDETEIGPPLDAGRGDLADAQARSARMLLDAAGVAANSHVLVQPAAGGALAIAAAKRGATVDCVAADEDARRALHETLVFAGVADAVHVQTEGALAGANATPAQPRAGYDAVLSAEHLETLAPRHKAAYLRELEDSLAPGGKVAVQTVIATEALNPAGKAALESVRAYIWPGLSYAMPAELHKLADRHSGLRMVAVTRAPQHLAQSLSLQRSTFDTNLRDAAADGFDAVYRRLWTWQLALRQALAELGMLDLAQVTLTRRHRGGRR